MAIYTSTKSQIFSLDLIIAAALFTTGLIFFYTYSVDLMESQQDTAGDLAVDANLLSNFIVSKGYPEGWNTTNVVVLGVCDDYRLNETKVNMFSEIDYDQTRVLLSTHNNYYYFFEDSNGNPINIGNVTGIGKPGINSTNLIEVEDPLDIVKVYRYCFYNSQIIRMGLYVW